MSANERLGNINSTLILQDEPKKPLTNGQIAGITIGTIFAFFLTMLLIVCIGEYWKYIKGKKKRPMIRHHRRTATNMSTTRGDHSINQSHPPLQPESSISQSELVTSSSIKDSESSTENAQRHRHSSVVDGAKSSIFYTENYKISNLTVTGYGDTFDNFDTLESVDLNLDCVDACDVDVKSEDEVTMVPLILQPCDDAIEVDGEIFCDSVDSMDALEQYNLEADV